MSHSTTLKPRANTGVQHRDAKILYYHEYSNYFIKKLTSREHFNNAMNQRVKSYGKYCTTLVTLSKTKSIWIIIHFCYICDNKQNPVTPRQWCAKHSAIIIRNIKQCFQQSHITHKPLSHEQLEYKTFCICISRDYVRQDYCAGVCR